MSKLDETANKIIGLLRSDPRISNKAIAKKIGVVEATVASRLRQLRDNRDMCVALRRGYHSLGLHLQSFIELSISGRPAEDIADELAKVSAIKSIVILFGKPELMLVVFTPDHEALVELIENDIQAVDGIDNAEVNIVLDVRKVRLGYADLKAEYSN